MKETKGGIAKVWGRTRRLLQTASHPSQGANDKGEGGNIDFMANAAQACCWHGRLVLTTDLQDMDGWVFEPEQYFLSNVLTQRLGGMDLGAGDRGDVELCVFQEVCATLHHVGGRIVVYSLKRAAKAHASASKFWFGYSVSSATVDVLLLLLFFILFFSSPCASLHISRVSFA